MNPVCLSDPLDPVLDINSDPVGIATSVTVGDTQIQEIYTNNTPTSGVRQLQYTFNGIEYLTSSLAFDIDATQLQIELQAMFSAIANADPAFK